MRIGLGYVRSVGEEEAKALVAERTRRAVPRRRRPRAPRAAGLDARELEALVRRGACDGCGQRRDLLWQLGLVSARRGARRTAARAPARPDRRDARAAGPDRLGAHARRLRRTSVSVGVHPLELLRPHLPADVLSSAELPSAARRAGRGRGDGGRRQRPATAKGIVFMLLEDEHGQVNLIVGAGGLRAAPRDRPRRAAAARPRPLRAGRRQPQHRRLRARDPRPARAPRLGAAGGGLQPAWSPPFRPSLTQRLEAADALALDRGAVLALRARSDGRRCALSTADALEPVCEERYSAPPPAPSPGRRHPGARHRRLPAAEPRREDADAGSPDVDA